MDVRIDFEPTVTWMPQIGGDDGAVIGRFHFVGTGKEFGVPDGTYLVWARAFRDRVRVCLSAAAGDQQFELKSRVTLITGDDEMIREWPSFNRWTEHNASRDKMPPRPLEVSEEQHRRSVSEHHDAPWPSCFHAVSRLVTYTHRGVNEPPLFVDDGTVVRTWLTFTVPCN